MPNPTSPKTKHPDFSGLFVTAYSAKVANSLSGFVKDVRTLADAGELADMLRSVRELSRHMKVSEEKSAA